MTHPRPQQSPTHAAAEQSEAAGISITGFRVPRSALRAKLPPITGHRSPVTARSAFSLIEVLVVISILLILAAIGIPALTAALSQSSKAVTQSTLQGAMGVETEMRATSRQILLHTEAPASYGDHRAIEYFVVQAASAETSRKMLESLPQGDKDGDGRREIWDDWENPLRYRSSNDSGNAPKHPTPFFHSAGPDGDFGNFNAANEPTNDAGEDDILSFEIEE